jgi:hypothetical protein
VRPTASARLPRTLRRGRSLMLGEDGAASGDLDALSILAARILMYSSSSARFFTARAYLTRHATSCPGVTAVPLGPVRPLKLAMRVSATPP